MDANICPGKCERDGFRFRFRLCLIRPQIVQIVLVTVQVGDGDVIAGIIFHCAGQCARLRTRDILGVREHSRVAGDTGALDENIGEGARGLGAVAGSIDMQQYRCLIRKREVIIIGHCRVLTASAAVVERVIEKLHILNCPK